MEIEKDKYEKAKKIVKEKMDFLRHLVIYCVVMAILAIINNATTPGGYQWWLWPAGGWGIGVFINFLSAFIFRGGGLKRLEERLTQKELEKRDE